MYCFRKVGRVPGRLASSIASWRSVSSYSVVVSRAVVSEGCEMLFWPVMTSPLARPAEIWWVKLVLMAGRTDVWLGTEQMLESR